MEPVLARLQSLVDKKILLRTLLSQVASPSKHFLVEYSSPNIAKPFHAGHLRSTLIGRFIVNILRCAGHKVTSVNWLGDWGTQFGILARGFAEFGDLSKIDPEQAKDSDFFPLEHLFEVRANQCAKNDKTFAKESLEWFSSLENGSPECVAFWKLVRHVSIKEFELLYNKLNIDFDCWHSESMYAQKATQLMQEWKQKGFLSVNENDVTGVQFGNRFLSVVKSDGSTLYLARDVTTAIERNIQFEPDYMYYVVDNNQSDHFKSIKAVLNSGKMEMVAEKINHIKFGRIEGMSTREGNVIFVESLLAAGITKVLEMIENDRNIRISDDEKHQVCEQLTLSALTMADLKEHRTHNYEFSWKRALDVKGASGVRLQATHARLCSIERNNSEQYANFWSEWQQYGACNDIEAMKLCDHLIKLGPTLEKTYSTLEAYHLVQYLFKFSKLVNSAKKTLRVSDEKREVAIPRLFLFVLCRKILAECLEVFGLDAIEKF